MSHKNWVDARCVFERCKNRNVCYEKGYICPAMSNLPTEFNPMKQKIVEVKIQERTDEEKYDKQ